MSELAEWFLYLLPLNLAATYALVSLARYTYGCSHKSSVAVAVETQAPQVPPIPLPPPKPEVRFITLRFFYREDENKRFRAAILPPVHQVDDVNPNGWASIAEMEADLPRAICEMYELRGSGLVALAHYHHRSRTMLIMMRSKPNDWQITPEGKVDLEKYLVQVRIPGTNLGIAHDSRDPALFPPVKPLTKSSRKKPSQPKRKSTLAKRKRAA